MYLYNLLSYIILLILIIQYTESKFIFNKYPQTIFNGLDPHNITGKWMTFNPYNNNNINNYNNYKYNTKSKITTSAASEGVYKMDQYDLRIFTHLEARECLHDRTIFIAGDSYMVQLTIGLVDILMNENNNTEIYGSLPRTYVMWDRLEDLRRALHLSEYRIDLHYTPKECRGKPLHCLQTYLETIKKHPAKLKRKTTKSYPEHGMDLLVVNILTHHILQLKEEQMLNATLVPVSAFEHSTYAHQIKDIFEKASRYRIPLMWTTGPG